MPSLGGWEFVVLIGVLVLLFGATRLPGMARSLGQSARVFKGELKGLKADDEARAKEKDKQQQALPPAADGPQLTPPIEEQARPRDAT